MHTEGKHYLTNTITEQLIVNQLFSPRIWIDEIDKWANLDN